MPTTFKKTPPVEEKKEEDEDSDGWEDVEIEQSYERIDFMPNGVPHCSNYYTASNFVLRHK